MDMLGMESICKKFLSFYFNNFSIVLAILGGELRLCPAESYLLCTEFKVYIEQIQKELWGTFSQL